MVKMRDFHTKSSKDIVTLSTRVSLNNKRTKKLEHQQGEICTDSSTTPVVENLPSILESLRLLAAAVNPLL